MALHDVDLVGLASITSILRQTGFPKFQIVRRGMGKNTTPVFECLHVTAVETAVKHLEQWAQTLLVANPNNFVEYEIICWKEGDAISEDENPKRYFKNRVRFSFILSAIASQNSFNNQQQIQQPMIQPQGYSADDIAKLVAAESEKLFLRHMVKEQDKKIKELEEEIEELEEEGEEDSGMGFLGQLTKMLDKKKEQTQGALAAPHDNEEKIKRINAAILKLSKYDPNLHISLEKLVDIAENENAKFKMLLSML